MWKCPKCGNKDHLAVDVVIQVHLRQDADNFETDDVGNDHEWDENSTMYCGECSFIGEAGQFETENQECDSN